MNTTRSLTRIARTTLVALALVVPAGFLGACSDSGGSGDPLAAPDLSAYPITPEELGSGTPLWAETTTADGWAEVTNGEGATLGYSPSSGLALIQVDSYAFKDLNGNGVLDAYEDWRQTPAVRSVELANSMSAEEILPLMMHDSVFAVLPGGSDGMTAFGTSFFDDLDLGVRSVLNFANTGAVEDVSAWNNNVQAHVEGVGYSIPVTISANPTNFGGNSFAENIGLAASFDPDFIQQIAEVQALQYRALGITTLLGPQIDLSTDPRWSRTTGTWGEDPALARDLTNAYISGLQSTYAADGTDLGWGADSVIGMMKHYPGDGPGEGGRESHGDQGKYNVYPGGAFQTSLVAFIDGGLHLDSVTGESAAVMTSYSIAYSEDGAYGDLVGSGFSAYKIGILRDQYNYDGLIVTDWGVLDDPGATPVATPWGVEDITVAERQYLGMIAGTDQFGGQANPVPTEAYGMLIDELGEEAALARVRDTARRLTLTMFEVGLFENPYVSTGAAAGIVNSAEVAALAAESQARSIVMLKNENDAIQAASGAKPTVYIPMVYSAGGYGAASGWVVPVDASDYFNVVTDSISDTLTGPADDEGNPTVSANDIVRASAEELAGIDFAVVFVSSPQNGGGYDSATQTYVPISLQYGPYTADSAAVRQTSIAGDLVAVQTESVYGTIETYETENRSYYGQSAQVTNSADLALILDTVARVPESAKVIVAIATSNPPIVAEFESQVDAIVLGWGSGWGTALLDVISGQVEPTGLLPVVMPKDMESVEASDEDVPQDVTPYTDSVGNTYDFAFGLNWSGVISDSRTETYDVAPLTAPAN
jgi:beta-glucosidase